MALLTFSQAVNVRVPLTTDRARIRGELAQLTASGPTALRDAVWAALQLRPDDGGRTLLLIFSDGIDNTSWLSTSDLLTGARRADVVIHAVGLPDLVLVPTRLGTAPTPMPSVFLEELADAGGGRHWSATSERELHELFTRALDEMRARYLVTFYPDGVPREGWHELKVTVRGANVTTRSGYYVPPA
jgi:VWFA-related protein